MTREDAFAVEKCPYCGGTNLGGDTLLRVDDDGPLIWCLGCDWTAWPDKADSDSKQTLD